LGYYWLVSDATRDRHPRTRALRVGHVFVTGWLVLGSIVVAVLAHDLAAGLASIGLMSVGDALGVLAAGDATPRNRRIDGAERTVVVVGLWVTLALAIVLLIATAARVAPAVTLAVPLMVAVATAAFASISYWRAGPDS
jgi:hypothetical protein